MKKASAVEEEKQSEESSGLHKFRIDRRLGRGAFGTDYKAEVVQTNEPVALKITVLDGHNAAVKVIYGVPYCHLC